MHRKFSAQHHGGMRDESMGQGQVQSLQRRQPSRGFGSSDDDSIAQGAELRNIRVAQQELGRIRAGRRAAARFRVHGLRQSRGRDVSAVAGTANHGALGCERSRGVRGIRRSQAPVLFQNLHRAGEPDKIFASLPFDSLDRFALERRVREIGSVKPPEDR